MPELPEVETVRRQLEPELVGRRIEAARVLDERLTRPEPPTALERAVSGRVVTAVARRGKYLLLGLEGGRTLALHLRMTGNLLLRDPQAGGAAGLMKREPPGGAPPAGGPAGRREGGPDEERAVWRAAPVRAGSRAEPCTRPLRPRRREG